MNNFAGSLGHRPRPNPGAAYDDNRIPHHSRLLVVQTPAVRDVVTTGRRLAHMNRSAPYGWSGLIVSGPARTGKTTAITKLGKTIEVFHHRRYPGCDDDIPVVYITVPPAATPRMIAAEFARFLGITVTRQAKPHLRSTPVPARTRTPNAANSCANTVAANRGRQTARRVASRIPAARSARAYGAPTAPESPTAGPTARAWPYLGCHAL